MEDIPTRRNMPTRRSLARPQSAKDYLLPFLVSQTKPPRQLGSEKGPEGAPSTTISETLQALNDRVIVSRRTPQSGSSAAPSSQSGTDDVSMGPG